MSDQICCRTDPKVRTVIERVAKQERRTVSNVVRNILEDWATAVERKRPGARRDPPDLRMTA
jgi:hypothetical protein